MIGYVRKRDVNTIMSFKISDKQLLKKYNQTLKKAKSLSNTKFDSKPVYGDNDKYIKTKIKIYSGSVNTNLEKLHDLRDTMPCHWSLFFGVTLLLTGRHAMPVII